MNSTTSQFNSESRIPKRARAGVSIRLGGFTLIELLVVISIIGVLAGLTVGLSGVASRKSKESRIRAEMNRLVTAVENYKARLGFYPPGNERIRRDASGRIIATVTGGVPDTSVYNQLYYELSGTLYYTKPGQNVGVFHIPGHDPATGLTPLQITTLFGTDGFSNSARDRRNIRITTEFKAGSTRTIANPDFEILTNPVPPPLSRLPNGPLVITDKSGVKAYPWFYDSTSTNRFNQDKFDLWTEVEIGKKIVRFSNWESGPVVIGP